MTILIRSATPDDLHTLVDFVLAEAREAEARVLDPEIVTAAVGAALADRALARYWVADDTGFPCAAVGVVREWSDWHNTAYWWIQLAYVAPEYRGRGVIRGLVEHVQAVALSQNVPELRLYVDPTNARAIRAYEKLGFATSSYVMMTLRH